MPALLAVTAIWSLSFGLVGELKGLNPFLISTVRLGLATLCLVPFLRPGVLRRFDAARLCGIGAVQFGLMYITYISAYQFVPPYLVAIFSVFTPLWVIAIDSVIRRRLRPGFLVAALLATAGAALLKLPPEAGNQWLWGFLLMQLANFSFALGQVFFREWKLRNPAIRESEVFGWLLLGGTAVAASALVAAGPAAARPLLEASATQIAILVPLGVVASGLGFFLWNYGASRVNTGVLAAANNLVVPAAAAFALVLRPVDPDWPTFLAGTGLVLGGLLLAHRIGKPSPVSS